MNSLTFHFAVQLAKDGVRVNGICPGPIDTPMIDAQANLPGSKGNGKEILLRRCPFDWVCRRISPMGRCF